MLVLVFLPWINQERSKFEVSLFNTVVWEVK